MKNSRFLGIIPARYDSSRFPGKPLVDINGKTMIQRVYEQARKCSTLNDVIVATDDLRIKDAVVQFGGKAIITSSDHQSGSDRCLEAMEKIAGETDVVVNIQGDEPFMDPLQIESLCHCFEDPETDIATLAIKIDKNADLFNPNRVKVLINDLGFASLFSRQAMPYQKSMEMESWLQHHSYFKHLGIYAYRKEALREISALAMSSWERAESLEQLRWLQNGFKIKVAITTTESESVDTPEDLENILKKYSKT